MPPSKNSTTADGAAGDDSKPAGPADTAADGGGQADATAAAAAAPVAPAGPTAAPVKAPARRTPAPATPPKAAEPHAAVREVPAAGHIAIVGHDDTPLTADDLFDDHAPHTSSVVTKQRIYQTFMYPGTTTPAKQLVYAAGVRVPREHAARLKAVVTSQTAAAATPAAPPAGEGQAAG